MSNVMEWRAIETAPIGYGVRVIGSFQMKGPLGIRKIGVVKRLAKYGALNAYEQRNLCWKDDNNKEVELLYWMPLPPPPETKSGTGVLGTISLFSAKEGKPKTLKQLKVEIMTQIINFCGGNICEAARVLKIGRSTIYLNTESSCNDQAK